MGVVIEREYRVLEFVPGQLFYPQVRERVCLFSLFGRNFICWWRSWRRITRSVGGVFYLEDFNGYGFSSYADAVELIRQYAVDLSSRSEFTAHHLPAHILSAKTRT